MKPPTFESLVRMTPSARMRAWYKATNSEPLPDGLDREVVDLCRAMNHMDGIATNFSCSGHGKERFWISFHIESIDALPPLLDVLSGFRDWEINISTIGAMHLPLVFNVHGPVGERAYLEAKQIAAILLRYDREAVEAENRKRATEVCRNHRKSEREANENDRRREAEIRALMVWNELVVDNNSRKGVRT